MERVIGKAIHDIDNTFYGKFVKNQDKIRKLALANPNSYAAVVVEAVDHFTTGEAMIEHHGNASLKSVCFVTILKEFADSLRASEIFALWTPELRRKVQAMASNVIKCDESSDVDRDARICYGMLMVLTGDLAAITKAIKFHADAKEKYPTEIFFWRSYCYLFSFTKEWDAGLKASDEAIKIFPNDANILNARAMMLRMMTDVGDVDYVHWSKQKKQAEDVKQAFKDYLKIASKDHRHFADNNYFVAYFTFKYAAPSSRMMTEDMRDISFYFQSGLNAEKDIIPCFLPYTSQQKNYVAKSVNIHPTVNVYHEGNTCTIDMTTHGMPGRPKTGYIPTENMIFIPSLEPTKR